MYAWLHPGRVARRGPLAGPGEAALSLIAEQRAAWAALPRVAQFYIAGVIALGAYVMVAWFPLTYPRPFAFAALLVVCLPDLDLEGQAGSLQPRTSRRSRSRTRRC